MMETSPTDFPHHPTDMSDAERKQLLVDAVPFWWHTIDLGDGVITPGWTWPETQQAIAQAVPADLSGKTVLDIGAWDGYFTFLAERRGAEVTALENYQHVDFVRSRFDVEIAKGAGFRAARAALGSKATLIEGVPEDLDDAFDVVFYMGMLYHQRELMPALDGLRQRTKEVAIIETHYQKELSGTDVRFYPGATLNNDPTVYWGPALDAFAPLLEEAGFGDVQLHSIYGSQDDRAIFHARV